MTYLIRVGSTRPCRGKPLTFVRAFYDISRVSFYNLVTDFYEYGWGQSFHFAPRRKNETFRESIRRAEYVLASRIEVGCCVQALMYVPPPRRYERLVVVSRS